MARMALQAPGEQQVLEFDLPSPEGKKPKTVTLRFKRMTLEDVVARDEKRMSDHRELHGVGTPNGMPGISGNEYNLRIIESYIENFDRSMFAKVEHAEHYIKQIAENVITLSAGGSLPEDPSEKKTDAKDFTGS